MTSSIAYPHFIVSWNFKLATNNRPTTSICFLTVIPWWTMRCDTITSRFWGSPGLGSIPNKHANVSFLIRFIAHGLSRPKTPRLAAIVEYEAIGIYKNRSSTFTCTKITPDFEWRHLTAIVVTIDEIDSTSGDSCLAKSFTRWKNRIGTPSTFQGSQSKVSAFPWSFIYITKPKLFNWKTRFISKNTCINWLIAVPRQWRHYLRHRATIQYQRHNDKLHLHQNMFVAFHKHISHYQEMPHPNMFVSDHVQTPTMQYLKHNDVTHTHERLVYD